MRLLVGLSRSDDTEGWVHSSPVVLDGVVYVGLDDSYLYALDALVRG